MLADLRFAARLLLKNPGTTLTAVLALGFGLGLSTTIFNAFSAILLRPMPHVQDESRIVVLRTQSLNQPDNLYELSMPDFLDLRAQSKTLDGGTTYMMRTMILPAGATPLRVLGADISPEAFAMLGVKAHRGRIFTPEDGRADAPSVAILSYGLWQSRFGGRDDVIGRKELMNGAPTLIIGVMPQHFAFPERQEMWTPLRVKYDPQERGSHNYNAFARLRPGVTLDEARTEIAALSARLARAHPVTNENKSIHLRPLREDLTDDVQLLMQLMLGAAISVLLIACANVANLLLARAAGRAHEVAIRVSVGATRGRIIRQVLTECLLLGALAGAFGLLTSLWLNGLFVSAIPSVQLPPWVRFELDWGVFAFATAAAFGSSLVFGLFPALHVSRTTATELKEGTRAATGGQRAQRLRQILVVSQVALSAVLLIVAGLFVRSFLKVNSAPTGYDARGVITFRVGLPPTQFRDPAEVRQFFDALTPELNRVPGVIAAGATTILPTKGNNSNVFFFEGDAVPKTISDAPLTTSVVVSRRYFTAMGIPVVGGRPFADTDTRETPRVCLVDQQFVARWSPDRDPIGRRVRFGLPDADKPDTWGLIVGVVANAPLNLDQPYERGTVYSLMEQEDVQFVSYAVRVTGDPSTYGPALQRAVQNVKPGIPIYDVQTMRHLAALNQWHRKFFGQVFSAFGVGALFLAALGVYSVMAYSVAQRTPEIGVRMALGASPEDVMRLVGRQGFRLVLAGLVTGVLAALGVAQFLGSLLFRVSPFDPPTYFVLTLVLAVVGLVACWLPARRATRIDPLVALRAE